MTFLSLQVHVLACDSLRSPLGAGSSGMEENAGLKLCSAIMKGFLQLMKGGLIQCSFSIS
jgi:hypothetical protein